MYISGDKRQRSKFFDKTVEKLRTDLSTNLTVQEKLGVMAASRLRSLDDLVLLNERHGELRLPNKTPKSAIPIAIMHQGEKKVVTQPEALGMTAVQIHFATEQIVGLLQNINQPRNVAAKIVDFARLQLAADIDDSAFTVQQSSPKTTGVTASGVVLVNLRDVCRGPINTGRESSRLFSGRPITALFTGFTNRVPPYVTLYHELYHEQQFTCKPVRRLDTLEDDKFREELEARYSAGQYEAGLLVSEDPDFMGTDVQMTNLVIDDIRRQNMISPKDPFNPHAKLRQVLADQDIFF